MRTTRRSPGLSLFRRKPLYAALGLALAPVAAHAVVLTVNDASDANTWNSGTNTGTLRGAINFLNGSCSPGDTIAFDPSFTAAAPFVTSPATDLPQVACSGTTISGGGSMGDAASRVVIDGHGAALDYGLSATTAGYGGPITVSGIAVRNISGGPGLDGAIASSNNIVAGSAIGIRTTETVDSNRVFGNGLGIMPTFSNQQVTNNVVYGNTTGISASGWFGNIGKNTVGLDLLGKVAPNTTGIALDGSSATVGGNVISGNQIGIAISGGGNSISGNNIGTDSSGTSLRANDFGIVIDFAYGTSVSGNVIAASATGTAITVDESSSINISGNTINANSGETAVLGGGEGVVATCSFSVMVSGNFITSSGRNAIDFGGMTGSSAGDITGNTIGAVGSVANGISLHDATCSRPSAKALATPKLLLPPTLTTGETIYGNTITRASQNGIVLDGANNTNISNINIVTNSDLYGVEILSGTGNVVVDNFIYGNGLTLGAGAKNLDLGFHATTSPPSLPNDAGDVDTAPVPNDGQNYPEITAVEYQPFFNETIVSFVLDAQPGIYRIDFYNNNPATTVPGGQALFTNTFLSVSAPGGTPGSLTLFGQYSSISLTATLTNGNGGLIETSEYSPVNNSTLVQAVTVSPTTVNFGDVGINTSSAPRAVTVASTGTDTYQIDTVRTSDGTCYGGPICYGGEFSCTTTCQEGGMYAPGSSCSITATFQPTFTGPTSQVLRICDRASGRTRDITLLGNGIIPSPLVFDVASYDFGSVAVNHTSPPRTFTLLNPTSAPVSIGSFQTTPEFSATNSTCGGTLNPAQTCTVDVTFVPIAVGSVSGQLTIPTGGGLPPAALKSAGGKALVVDIAPSGAVASVALTGSGSVQGQLVLPTLVDFGTFIEGGSPLTRDVTLQNTGNATVTFNSVSVTGPFSMVNGCGPTLDPGASCTITLTLTAVNLGDYTGALNIATDAPGGSGSVTLTASVAVSPQPRLQVTPPQIGFGSRMIGTSTATQRITIKNIGSADATISSLIVNGADFVISSNTCGATLAASATCTADVLFRPLGFGLRRESFQVHSNAVNDPQGSQLSGTGCRPFAVTGGSSSCSP